jgi:hypothetical protein
LRDENKNKHKLVHDFEILYFGCKVSEKYANVNSETFIKMDALRNVFKYKIRDKLKQLYALNYNGSSS